MKAFAIGAALLPAVLWTAAVAGEIDVQKSVMTVRVFKTGIFSVLGHEHEISAHIKDGTLSKADHSVEFTVDARQMRVMDKDVSEKDRAEIQENMLGPKVLDSEKYPEIRFRSTAVEPAGEGRWSVSGDLTLRGQARPLKLAVRAQGGHYQGTVELKQRDFGIEPISIGGGAVKVKNELRVEFDIAAKP
ncbi:MAG TPA: YceI family protein [Terriglobales bacterium]|nr:YceI family protein [Terriglobales bacterium]